MKKRLISFLLLACAVLMCIPAQAASTEAEWNASCNWVIAYNTTLYTASLQDNATTATDLYEFTAIGSIPAGSRVSIRSSSNGMREIYYWNGGKRSAWVNDSAVRWSAGTSGNTGEGSSSSGGSYATGTNLSGSYTPRIVINDTWDAFKVTWVQEDGTEVRVYLQELGTAQCVVYDGEELLTVPTADLVWETEAPESQRMAVIHAPKTGKATLRAEAKSSSKALDQCKAGRIVIVLRVGKTYSRILYEGKEGLVLNGALDFCPVVPKDEYTTETLSYKGRTDSSATISVYTATDADRKIKQWRVGNDVVVLGEKGSWSEIEIEGWHGFVKTDYLD